MSKNTHFSRIWLIRYVTENGENHYTSIRHSDLAFLPQDTECYSETVSNQFDELPCLTESHFL